MGLPKSKMIQMKKICMSLMLLSSTACVTVTANKDSNTGVIPSTVDGSYTIGPNYTADPALEPCSGNGCEQGETFNLFMPTKDSAYYNCDMDDNPSLSANCSRSCFEDAVKPGYREVTVYVPAAYNDGDETGVMMMQDGINDGQNVNGGSIFKDISNVMDNFIGSEDDTRSLPTLVLIAVEVAGVGSFRGMLMGNPCFNDQGSERYNEYETMSGKYARFVNDEVIPFVTNHPDIKSKYSNLKITDNPAGRAAYGCSHGGVAALKMAFFRPDLFGIVIAYSTTLVEFPGIPEISEEYPLGNAEFWVPKPEGQELIKSEPKKPIRIFHSVGEWDMGNTSSTKNFNWVAANNETATALTAMDYETRYAYGLEAIHCDPPMLAQDMPNTLVWAWDDWKKKQSATNNGTAIYLNNNTGKDVVEDAVEESITQTPSSGMTCNHFGTTYKNNNNSKHHPFLSSIPMMMMMMASIAMAVVVVMF